MDVIFREDESKKQAKDSAKTFSLINKVALNMIKSYKPDEARRGSKVISMARKRKMANRENEYLLDILLAFNTDN